MQDLLDLSPVIPVVVIEDAGAAIPLARALVAGGVRPIEVTLRTPAALDAIRAMTEVEGAVVGAGTVLTERDLEAAKAAGALFAVSPGSTPSLLRAARDLDLPLLPGVATASELMMGLEAGYDAFKFFPAANIGGPGALAALAGPFPRPRFCPTGGVTLRSAPDYLALPNVGCVGGSWLTPKVALEAGDWAHVEGLAREAVDELGKLRRAR